jgi:hypothetical protein
MVHLNDWKRRGIRNTAEYQAVLLDLVDLGIVKEEDFKRLTDRRGNLRGVKEEAPIALPKLDIGGGEQTGSPSSEQPPVARGVRGRK